MGHYNILRLKIIVCLFFLSIKTIAQNNFDKNYSSYFDLRGVVLDKEIQKPIIGATIKLLGSQKQIISDSVGQFSFLSLPFNNYSLEVTCIGYKPIVLDNINLQSGKQKVLTILMDISLDTSGQVIVRSVARRNRPLNEMSQVSARAFTVEETQKYAAAVNDPLRMAASYPGIVSLNDNKNDIIIRGNAPGGLLWRMEGMDIPNPNHFGSIGGTGGTLSILSSQLLANSDFLTGAFPADYGNALSGVFDLHLRKGNNERKEYTLQAGLLGLDLAAEGPFSSHYNGSYLIDYRYSTLAILNKIGIPIFTGSSNFQDLSFNIFLPTQHAGDFSIFEIGGLSSNSTRPIADSTAWKLLPNSKYGNSFASNTAAAGVSHIIHLGQKSYLKSVLGYSIMELKNDHNFFDTSYQLQNLSNDNYTTKKWLLTSTFNHEFTRKLEGRIGLDWNILKFKYFNQQVNGPNNSTATLINNNSNSLLIQNFAELRILPTNKISIVTGIHYMYFYYNNSKSIEPRGSIRWEMNDRQEISFGYGEHSELQPFGVYFAQQESQAGLTYPNKNLDFTKAHHYVLSWNWSITKRLKFKTELYYQSLYNVPISTKDSTFSLVNIDENYITDPLVNKGKAHNYGIEFSLERPLYNNFYFLVNSSIYNSKYIAADGKERNTRYNGNYLNNLTIGKDFSLKNNRTIGINIKVIDAGGLRGIPIDVEKSKQLGYVYFNTSEAYELQYAPYFRTDLRFSMKWDRKKKTSTLSLDVQNVTNRSNIDNQQYLPSMGVLVTNYQHGIIPVINYKVEL